MALIRCPECGNSISDRAEKCPHCGLPASYFSSLSKNTLHMKEAGLDYKNLQNVLISFVNVTVQPCHLLVSIFMKTRGLVDPPYADLNKKVFMQANLQHAFSFKSAHG